MSIFSISLTNELAKFVEDEVASGEYESKGQLIKKALKRYQDEVVVERLLKASREVEEGKILRGDLKSVLKKVK